MAVITTIRNPKVATAATTATADGIGDGGAAAVPNCGTEQPGNQRWRQASGHLKSCNRR
jgi:hypothetical protein